MGQAGCQPPWRRFSFDGMPDCDNITKLRKYDEEKKRVVGLGPAVVDKEDVLNTTKCLQPCSYIEYKVSFTVSMCCANVQIVLIFLI